MKKTDSICFDDIRAAFIVLEAYWCEFFFSLSFNSRQFNKNRGLNHIENNYYNKYKGINVHTRSVNRICAALLLLPCTLNTVQRLWHLFPSYSTTFLYAHTHKRGAFSLHRITTTYYDERTNERSTAAIRLLETYSPRSLVFLCAVWCDVNAVIQFGCMRPWIFEHFCVYIQVFGFDIGHYSSSF